MLPLIPPLVAAAKFVGARLATTGAVQAAKFAVSPAGRHLIKNGIAPLLGIQFSTNRNKFARTVENGWNLGEKAYAKGQQLGIIPKFGGNGGRSGTSGRNGRGNNQGNKTPSTKKQSAPKQRPNRRTG